jgi:hypothetical protein
LWSIKQGMRENRIGLGHLLSGAGALIALVSLWLPWLKVDIGKIQQQPAFRAAFEAGGIPTQIKAEVNRYLAQLPDTISGNGWEVLQRTDIAFGLGSAAIVALIYATVMLGADSRATAKIASAVGMTGMFLVVLKLSSPGVPEEASDFVTRGPGPMMALIGWAICAAGGVLVLWNPPSEQQIAAPEPVETQSTLTPEYKPDPAAATTSIAPPPR